MLSARLKRGDYVGGDNVILPDASCHQADGCLTCLSELR
ncbi:hypothetical protein YpB42003004_1396 [Yersinia pestis biovar Antiqua str. B42003004]|nr:hypothetical protein YpB42003004_1396 [Yersinia pestis biovar Antiqua str. B42003004]EDR57860.1 hypothetical protein YpMG051020_3431 [Yersinia pestis biovar Orientalis str. MG05-1020]EIQ90148.1 hypothetical protein YPPY02_2318 [Yersinia pestis PY-02]